MDMKMKRGIFKTFNEKTKKLIVSSTEFFRLEIPFAKSTILFDSRFTSVQVTFTEKKLS